MDLQEACKAVGNGLCVQDYAGRIYGPKGEWLDDSFERTKNGLAKAHEPYKVVESPEPIKRLAKVHVYREVNNPGITFEAFVSDESSPDGKVLAEFYEKELAEEYANFINNLPT